MKRKLLFVDESSSLYDDLKSVFREEILSSEYEIFYAKNRKQALEIIENNELDLLLTDLYFNNIPLGWKIIEAIKQKNIMVKIIILASYVSYENRIRSLKEHVVTILEKPVLFADLKPYIKFILNWEEMDNVASITELTNLKTVYEAASKLQPRFKARLVNKILKFLDEKYLKTIELDKYLQESKTKGREKFKLIEKQKKGEINLKVDLEKIGNFSISKTYRGETGPYYYIHYWQDGKTKNIYVGKDIFRNEDLE